MKVIISHDVDHLTAWEHWKDGILPKLFLRSTWELLTGSITARNYFSLFGELFSNRWQYIAELTRFDTDHRIPATYFVAIKNGLGLSYSLSHAAACIQQIQASDFDVGLHGIAFDDLQGIRRENELFRSISGVQDGGIRMHYLRMGDQTLAFLAQAGYLYDTSLYQLASPFVVNGLIEFPLHIMDVRVMYQGSRFRSVPLQQAKVFTLDVLRQAQEAQLPYLTVLLHDRYFCAAYSKWRDWYTWLIETLQEAGVEFISYNAACREILETPGLSSKS